MTLSYPADGGTRKPETFLFFFVFVRQLAKIGMRSFFFCEAVLFETLNKFL